MDDEDFGYWLKDLPYIWSSHKREYLLFLEVPSDEKLNILDKNIPNDNSPWIYSLFFPNVEEYFGKDIKNYFSVRDTASIPNSMIKDLRMNGIPLTIPEKMKGYVLTDIKTIYKIYRLNEWDDVMIYGWPNLLLLEKEQPVNLPVHTTEHINLTDDDIKSAYILFWFLDVVEKYDHVCMPIINKLVVPANVSDLITFYSIEMSMRSNENDIPKFSKEAEYNKQYIVQIFNECMKDDDINIIIMQLVFEHLPSERRHANFLLIKKKESTIYIFDPHGMSWNKYADRDVKYFVEEWMKLKPNGGTWKYKKSEDWCPVISFQKFEQDPYGFCGFWNMYFIETILANQNESLKTITRRTINGIGNITPDFKKFISEYASTIHDFGEKMMKELDLNSEFISEKDAEKIEDYIVNVKNIKYKIGTSSPRSTYSEAIKYLADFLGL